MEHRERREPLGLSDLLLVYHDFLLALSRRTERLIQDFNAFIQCFNGRWMAAGCHNKTGSLNPFGYEKSRTRRLINAGIFYHARLVVPRVPLQQEIG